MTNTVDIKLRGQNKDLQRALKQSERNVMSFSKKAKAALAVVASAFAFQKLYQAGSRLITLYRDQEAAEARLRGVLQTTQHAAGLTAEQLHAIAASMQEVTGVSDEVIINAQAITATFKNIRGDEFVRATKAALDMKAVLGSDLKSASIQLGKALNDPLKGMSALAEVGVSFSQEQRTLIENFLKMNDVAAAQRVILDELDSEFGGVAAEINKTNGPINDMWISLSNLGEVIGSSLVPVISAVLVPVLDTTITVVSNLAAKWDGMGTSIGDLIGVIGQFVEQGLVFLGKGFVATFSVIEVMITNFKSVWDLTINGALLTITRFVSEIEHHFTVRLPAYFDWFLKNWMNVLSDMQRFQQAALTNLGKNFINFFSSVSDWFSGGEFDFTWTSLTDGFEKTMEELPVIAERKKSSYEKALEGAVASAGSSLTNSFTDAFDRNMDYFSSLFKKKQDEAVDLAVDPEAYNAPRIAQGTGADSDADNSGTRAPAGRFVGLTELSQKIAEAAASTPEKKQLEATEKVADKVDTVKDAVQKQTLDLTKALGTAAMGALTWR